MKKLILTTLIYLMSSSAHALTMPREEALTQLGISTATEPGSLTTELVNEAYSLRIRQQLAQVMTGSSVAVAASQKIAEARMVLLKELKPECADYITAVVDQTPSPVDPKKDKDSTSQFSSHLQINWLNSLYPAVFPPSFNPFDEDSLQAVLPKLASHPNDTLFTFQLLDEDLRALSSDANTNLLFSYQRHAAVALGNFLRLKRISQPDLVKDFEYGILAKLFELGADSKHLNRFLHLIGALNLNPGRVQMALVPMLDDPRVDIRKLVVGVLMHASSYFGLPPNLETELLRSRNTDALEILVSSRKPLNDETYIEILKRLEILTDDDVLKAVTRAMLGKPEWARPTLEALKSIRDNQRAVLLNRLYASQQLIDARVDVEESQSLIIMSLPVAIGDELFQLTNWCLSSTACSPRLRSAIKAARIPQRHQTIDQTQISDSKYHRS